MWSLGFFISGLFAVYGPQETLPEGQVGGYGYNQLFEAIGVGLLAPNVLVIGFLIAYVTGVIVLRMNLPAALKAHPGDVTVVPRGDQDE